MLFYTNVCGNVQNTYTRDQIDSMLKSEFLTALQPAFARISDMGIRYSGLPGHTTEMADAMNEAMSRKWTELRGIQVYSVGINSVTASKEDEDMIKELQKTAVMRDPNMAAANLAAAQADAMRDAANNSSGAMTGFMGMGFAQQAGGSNAQGLFAMGQQQNQPQQNQPQQSQPQQEVEPQQAVQYRQEPQQSSGSVQNQAAAGQQADWICSSCGTTNHGNFCTECGNPRPKAEWICSNCGTTNKGKFCTECGTKRP
jgi:membrane protease subunit (stomatin/prohibitin family)